MKYPQAMDFQALKRSIHAEAQEKLLEILYEDVNHITVLHFADEGDDLKELTFTNPRMVDARWLRKHIWIHPSITGILLDDIASTLTEMDPNTFITLRHLIILPHPECLQDYVQAMIPADQADRLLSTAPQKCRHKAQPIGQLWSHANCAIVYIDSIREAAKETIHGRLTAWESFHMCAWETIFHELRHLMMDCNPFLSEADYPSYLASEEAVEDFCRKEYDRIFGYC